MPTVSWTIDEADRLIDFSNSWSAASPPRFASELAPDRYLGRPLSSVITPGPLRELYAGLLRQVRTGPARMHLAYRCDMPDLHRLYVLAIQAIPDGRATFATRLVRRWARERQALWESAPTSSRADGYVFCSQCNRVHVSTIGWFELEDVSTLALFRQGRWLALHPSLCDECRTRLGTYATRRGLDRSAERVA